MAVRTAPGENMENTIVEMLYALSIYFNYVLKPIAFFFQDVSASLLAASSLVFTAAAPFLGFLLSESSALVKRAHSNQWKQYYLLMIHHFRCLLL